MLTSEIVKEYCRGAGARVAGVAAASDFGAAPEGYRPTDALEGCVSVIVLGAPIPREAVLQEDTTGFIDLRSALNKELKDAAKQVAKQIKAAGHQSRAIGGMDGKWVDGNTRGPISLKHAAELAGLGVIGKNYLLTNPEHGSLLWFSAVLTDAQLAPDPKLRLDLCGGCGRCAAACPAHALDTPGSVAKKACAGHMFRQVNKKWEIVCFLCRKACPHRFGINELP
ncbi:MAG: 4Fe-4S binding protein [Oscillospiraceae bacterium]|jgi:epoxyqueuosine reductase QueG|nr:4Fe-4S binding protein [Oscillospiraceae bacterium]